MATFSALSPVLEAIAQQALVYCRQRYGQKGLKIEQGIHSSIAWRPTFHFRPKKFEIYAFEVSDIIFPEVIKAAAQDIRHFDGLIRVVQICPINVYQADKDQRQINVFRAQGFGMITVSAAGNVTEQFGCVPLAQFITESELDGLIKGLPQGLKVRVRAAHQAYLTSPTKGVQDCGEILEGLVHSIARQSASGANLDAKSLKKSAAALIDDMYMLPYYQNYRAALGGVRSFIKEHRNPASHAPKTAKEAAQRVRMVREGFIEALRATISLCNSAKDMHVKAQVYS